MATDSMPFIAIIGGFWESAKQDPGTVADAKKMAREIGATL